MASGSSASSMASRRNRNDVNAAALATAGKDSRRDALAVRPRLPMNKHTEDSPMTETKRLIRLQRWQRPIVAALLRNVEPLDRERQLQELHPTDRKAIERELYRIAPHTWMKGDSHAD
jgi:hypothetical protein